jgi:hypothetical protein
MAGTRKSRSSRKQHPAARPGAMGRIPSKRTPPAVYHKADKATSQMKLTELQHMAMSLGIPFGGKSKSRLVRDINRYK